MKRHFGEVHRPPGRGALENHFLHLRSTEEPRALLAEDPAHGVGHVGFAAAVRPDDRRHARLEHEVGGIRERLEAV